MLATRWFLLVSLLVPACGSNESLPFNEGCTPGTERCDCYPNDTCDSGLDCRSGLCVGEDAGGSGSGGGGNSGLAGSSGSGGSSGSSGSSGSGGTGTAGNAGAGGNGGTGGHGGTGGIGGTGGEGGTGEQCAAEFFEPELAPLDMFILLDRSGSMEGSKWGAVKAAVSDFVNTPADGHVGVGLGFFPPRLTSAGSGAATCEEDADCLGFGPCTEELFFGKTCKGDTCDPTGYATPVVPFQALPGAATPVQNALASTSTGGNTPMTPALQGSIQYGLANLAANPSHLTTIILVSDGLPEGCSGSDTVAAVADVAAIGLAADIRTFVVGIGDQLANFNDIAIAGGTAPALIIGAGANVSNALQEKLEEIRADVGCIFGVPVPGQGEIHDYDSLDVSFTPSGAQRQSVNRVAGEAQCGMARGYYLDDPVNPTTITLCPEVCDEVQQVSGELAFALGCEPSP